MKILNIKIVLAILFLLPFASCLDDLDQENYSPSSFDENEVFANETEAKSALAKLYASLALTGQQGPSGSPDISGIDEGASQFTRMLFNHQELTTETAVISWGDPGLPNFHDMNWGSGNDFITAIWFRMAQEISFTNSFITNASGLAEGSDEARSFVAEARFLRAYTYYILMDIFGNVPIVTEISTTLPQQNSREEVFQFIESELLAITSELKEPRANEYGRVDKAAAWALLSKLYLNAEVYTGQARYSEAAEYANMVINSSYSINTNDANNNGTAYDELFLADNNTNGAQDEFIFALLFDGIESTTYGGTTFIIHAATGGSMDPAALGINGGWGGLRTTKGLVSKFDASSFNAEGEPIDWSDHRAMFFTEDQSYEIDVVTGAFEQGYTVTKFKNINSDGTPGSDAGGDFADTDLPIIRTAEIYLNYAEAVLRGGNGDLGLAVDLVNQLRKRGFGNDQHNINSSNLTLDFILDERARELYWEGMRRTDLIRYGKFTGGSYLWPFKGGVPSGTSVPSYRRLFPIPADAIGANPNYSQNPGY